MVKTIIKSIKCTDAHDGTHTLTVDTNVRNYEFPLESDMVMNGGLLCAINATINLANMTSNLMFNSHHEYNLVQQEISVLQLTYQAIERRKNVSTNVSS